MSNNNNDNGSNKPPDDNDQNRSNRPICRKFLWGTCNKHNQCRFRHELDISEMINVIKFCHDYQNRKGCSRDVCRLIHATKEEQNLFKTEGQIPQALADRHTAMNIALGLESALRPAAPPPPPSVGLPLITLAPPPPPPLPVPPAPSVPTPVYMQPPPPPPPPTIPSTSTWPIPPYGNQNLASPSLKNNSGLPSTSHGDSSPRIPSEFDASVPPPTSMHIQGQCTSKHKLPEPSEAGPSKMKTRRIEDPQQADGACQNCALTAQRIHLYQREAERYLKEDEIQSLLTKKVQNELNIGYKILRTIVGREFFKIMAENVEMPELDGVNDTSLQHITSFNSGRFNSVQEVFKRLLDRILDADTGHNSSISPANHLDELSSLTGFPPQSTSPTLESLPDIFVDVLNLYRNAHSRQTVGRPVNQYHHDNQPTNSSRPVLSPFESMIVNGFNNGIHDNGQGQRATQNHTPSYPGTSAARSSGLSASAMHHISLNTYLNNTAGASTSFMNTMPESSYSGVSETPPKTGSGSSALNTNTRKAGPNNNAVTVPSTVSSTNPGYSGFFNPVGLMNGYTPQSFNGQAGFPGFYSGMPPPPNGAFFSSISNSITAMAAPIQPPAIPAPMQEPAVQMVPAHPPPVPSATAQPPMQQPPGDQRPLVTLPPPPTPHPPTATNPLAYYPPGRYHCPPYQ